jgi:hypothetical protein
MCQVDLMSIPIKNTQENWKIEYILKIIKFTFHSPPASILYKVKTLQGILWKSGTGQECLLYPLLFTKTLEPSIRDIKALKEENPCLLPNSMMVCLENSRKIKTKLTQKDKNNSPR